MGFSLCWLAVRGRSRGQVLRFLRLAPTGYHEEIPESEVLGLDLPGGWYVVVANEMPDHLTEPETWAELSKGGECVFCFVEEHVMVCEASHYRDGRRLWRVEHDGQQRGFHLNTEGTPPPEFAAIRARLHAEHQSNPQGVDYAFEVPVDLAKAIVGYRHDEDPPVDDAEPYERLEPK